MIFKRKKVFVFPNGSKMLLYDKDEPVHGRELLRSVGMKPEKVFWSLETHGVSQGMLMEFLTCREKTRLSYIEGWASTNVSNAITFGSLFHEVMEDVYKQLKNKKEITEKYTQNSISFVLKKFKEETDKERLWTPEDETNHILNEGYLRIIVPAYLKKYLEKDKKHEWLIVEDSFQNTFEGANLKGRYDQAFRNVQVEIWIKEMKTKSRFDPALQDRLSFDFQAMFYILNYLLEFKVMPTGFVYDLIQRPALRQGKAETLQHFMARVKGDVDDSYFKRIRMRVTREELDQWVEKDFKPVLRDFVEWANGNTATFRNPSACETKFGLCRMVKVCGLKDYSNLYRKEHSLLEEKSI